MQQKIKMVLELEKLDKLIDSLLFSKGVKMPTFKDIDYLTVDEVLFDLSPYGITRNRLDGWRHQNKKGKDIGPPCVTILNKIYYPTAQYQIWKDTAGL